MVTVGLLKTWVVCVNVCAHVIKRCIFVMFCGHKTCPPKNSSPWKGANFRKKVMKTARFFKFMLGHLERENAMSQNRGFLKVSYWDGCL